MSEVGKGQGKESRVETTDLCVHAYNLFNHSFCMFPLSITPLFHLSYAR